MTFDPYASPINVVKLGDYTTPGIATVEDVALKYRWSSESGFGVSGALKFLRGRELTSFRVRVRLFDTADVAGWFAFVDGLKYRSGDRDLALFTSRTVKGLKIDHPLTRAYGIYEVTITSWMPLTRTADGVWETGVELEEHRLPVVSAGGKADSTAGSEDSSRQDPEIDSRRREAAALEAVLARAPEQSP